MDPNDLQYREFVIDSLNKHLANSGEKKHQKVVKIEKVTTQVVAGRLIRIKFKIAPTDCDITINPFDSSCEIRENADTQECNSKIWDKPWEHFREVDVSCNVVKTSRTKRQVVGGETEKDPNDLQYREFVIDSLNKHLATSGEKKHQKVVKIEKVTDQVVAGRLIRIEFKIAPTDCDITINPFDSSCEIIENADMQECNSKIWDKPWENFREVNVSCNVVGAPRTKRHAVGDKIETDRINNPEVIVLHNLLKEALQKLESSSLSKYRQRVFKLKDYSTKLTSGKLTTITFDVGYTSCMKYESVRDIKDCEFLSNTAIRNCVANIWERLWLKNGRIIDVNCQDDETILIRNTDPTNTVAAEQLAREALKHIEAKYPHPKKQKVVRIFSLQKQVVAGIHYRMKIEVGVTNCTALNVKDDCELITDAGSNKFCHVNIWLRPLNDHPPNFRVSCDHLQNFTAEMYFHLQADHLFNEFVFTNKPAYKDNLEELEHRFQVFKDNIKKIHELNTHEKGTAIYGITRFTDLSHDEFKTKYMGLKQSKRDFNQIPMRKADIPVIDLPQSFDWREHGAVTEVKNQGSCGSCWAFSVTGNIEGQWKLKTGKLESLSEQELVDCDKLDDGCQGGLPDNAYRAIESLGGLMAEKDYPYDGEDEKCVYNKTLSRVQISGAVNISSNETQMAKWLVAKGPISIGINANAMQFYMGGISHPWKVLCNPENLDHGVLIVGFGEKFYPLFNKRLPFWIVKNSWGKSWGEQGYYRVFRGDGTCGVNMMASSAVV